MLAELYSRYRKLRVDMMLFRAHRAKLFLGMFILLTNRCGATILNACGVVLLCCIAHRYVIRRNVVYHDRRPRRDFTASQDIGWRAASEIANGDIRPIFPGVSDNRRCLFWRPKLLNS